MTVLGEMGDITVLTFCILNCDDGGRDIAENSRPPVPRRLASEICVTLLWQFYNYQKKGRRKETIIRKVCDNPGKVASSWESWVTLPRIVI